MTDRTDDTSGEGFDPRVSTGAYALDALTAAETAEFERAVRSSASLREESDELRETAALIGLSVAPVDPSPELKRELMAKLLLTPQLPALPTESSRSETATDARADLPEMTPAARADEGLPTAVGQSAPVEARSAGGAENRARLRWFARPTTLVAAVAAAAALFVGGGFVGSALVNSSTTTDVADSSASELARITAASDVQRASVPVAGGGDATVVWSNELGRSAVLAEGLPELPEGKVYEAWYIDAKGPVAAGTFTAAESGTSWHVLEGTMSAGDTVGVTVEPAGGSQQPTTEPIFAVESA
ncbi:anti-sigma factor [Herbiconiux sp. VKM Ac-1786]|uniref:anti-sigma factor n=1 Tax=Herbiconiux sp. VKM Ac-1786 TaxID=2783824 RepID=UPI00188DB4C5|nr:anti-sigma factor [Herbiconiux sp. VKM Ac-1786]MBF4571313.1 anti-sigma factor [Herbiconiux sp. VKM Ac-1786]